MIISKKQEKRIKKEYPGKSVKQISLELNISSAQTYKILGLQTDLWDIRLENLTGCLCCILFLAAPFVFLRGLSNFADLPQRVFIQTLSIFILLVWSLRKVVTSELRIQKNPLFFVVSLFVIWSITSLSWAHYRHEGFYSVVHWAACCAIFLAVTTLNHDKWIKRILYSIIAAVAGVVILGLCQQLFSSGWVPVIRSPAAVFANPNMASQYVVIILPLVVSIGFSRKGGWIKYAAWIIAILSLVFLFYTQCRAAWVAIVCAAAWTAMLLAGKKFGSGLVLKPFAAFFAVLIVLVMAGVLTGTADDLVKKAGGSAKYRLIVWENSLEMVKEKPLTGFGAGGFKVFYPGYTYKATIDTAFSKEKQIRRAHNDFVQFAVELGIGGLLLFAALPLYGLFMAWHFIVQGNKPALNPVALGISAGLVSFMSTAFFSFPFQRSMPPLIVFTYLGIMTVLFSRFLGGSNRLKVKFPRAAGAIILFTVLVAGGALTSFNLKNITCDRYFHKAMAREKRALNKQALSAGLKANKYNPNRMDVLTTVGRAYVTTGKFDHAIRVLEEVVSKQPYNLNALFILGVAHANAGEKEKALEAFRLALIIKPDFREAKKIIASLKARGRVRIKLT